MTKKLTKNDSMSIKQHKFEVAASAFKALLYKRGLYESYFHAWNEYNWHKIDVKADIAWEEWAAQKPTDEWVSDAFVWDGSCIPSSVWRALSIDWVEFYVGYLN